MCLKGLDALLPRWVSTSILGLDILQTGHFTFGGTQGPNSGGLCFL